MSHEPHAALFEKGIAVGYSNVKNDTVLYRFRDETFEIPTIEACLLRWGGHGWNGYFYTAPVEKLRELKAKAKP